MIGKLQHFSHFIPKKIPFGLTDVSVLMVFSLFFSLRLSFFFFFNFLSDYKALYDLFTSPFVT